jgi:hypothetical protein
MKTALHLRHFILAKRNLVHLLSSFLVLLWYGMYELAHLILKGYPESICIQTKLRFVHYLYMGDLFKLNELSIHRLFAQLIKRAFYPHLFFAATWV